MQIQVCSNSIVQISTHYYFRRDWKGNSKGKSSSIPSSDVNEFDSIQALLLHNAKVYIAVRSEEKARYAINELREKTGKEAIFLKLDLADFKSIKASAEEFIRYP